MPTSASGDTWPNVTFLKTGILLSMKAFKVMLSHFGVLALIVQLMTPWQALHLGMVDANTGSALAQPHCPSHGSGHHGDHSEPPPGADAFSDTCERACGLVMWASVLPAITVLTASSTAVDAQATFLTPSFFKVPNPPPIV